jgi:molybdopterin synthase catalytic subunit
MRSWIDLVHTPLSVHIATTFLADAKSGAIDLFIGTTRADDPKLTALDYKAYTPMAMQQMHVISNQAQLQFQLHSLVILHRLGRVELTRPSVLIGVSTAHRAGAFDACRFIIDAIKKDVPIWKRDVSGDVLGEWMHPS